MAAGRESPGELSPGDRPRSGARRELSVPPCRGRAVLSRGRLPGPSGTGQPGVRQELFQPAFPKAWFDFASGLECDLATNLVGQPLVRRQVMKGLREFLENQHPEKPLVMSFHGSTGTGKTFVSSMLVRHLFQGGLKSPYVHQFSPIVHFPHAEDIEQYKVRDASCTVPLGQGLFWFCVIWTPRTYTLLLFSEVRQQ